jgi:hypothetical protein
MIGVKKRGPFKIKRKTNLLAPMQSVSIATDVVSSNLDEGEVTNIM